MSTPNYTFQLVATSVGGTSSLPAGSVLVYDPVSTTYLLATTANRGTKRASGICVAAASVNGATVMQAAGDIPAAITGLGAGAAGPVRVSAAGVLERVTTWAATDDVCGWAETDGTVHAFFGGAATGAVIVGDATGANQVLANPSTWGAPNERVISKRSTLLIAGATGAAQTIDSFAMPTSTAWDVLVTILARRNTQDVYRADLFATYNRISSAAPVLVGAAPAETNKRNDAGAAFTGALAISGNNILATITASGGQNLNVTAITQIQERT